MTVLKFTEQAAQELDGMKLGLDEISIVRDADGNPILGTNILTSVWGDIVEHLGYEVIEYNPVLEEL